ncbi:MAG TPA: polyphosphate kinase 1 [Methanomicrobiales archaeon]|nr:polyphosphate kinase 1 [Methanomicrobiales archaeon]
MAGDVNLEDPELFINRELGWIQFNERVLEEAEDPTHPLLERVKFFAICGSNLDEFFMVRVSGLQRQLTKPVTILPKNGLTPIETIDAIGQRMDPLLDRYDRCWNGLLVPELSKSGIRILKPEEISEGQGISLRRTFEEEIFPVLTPLAFDTTHPFPFISNLSINLAVELHSPEKGSLFSRIKIPKGLFPRFIPVPEPGKPGDRGATDRLVYQYILVEDLVRANLDLLFPGMEIVACYPFRVTRDADIEIREDEAHDLMSAIEESMEMRRTGAPVRLEVDRSLPARICQILASKFNLPADFVHRCHFPLGMTDLSELTSIPRPDLKDTPFLPAFPPGTTNGEDIYAEVMKGDILFYHPYDSFVPFIDLLQAAAHDPRVLSIKITLYRIDKGSPIVAALIEAREQGKQVTAVVELKARFDEERNITWARSLERAGVHVVYGMVGLKVHAKACLIVRKEDAGIVRYVHLSTGNYNAVTTRIYGDIGILTADPGIGSDVTDLFNALTGYSLKEKYRTLLVAPGSMREGILERIEREIERQRTHGDGYLAFKFNALEDKACIKALYRASMAGVRVDLNVRGFCCLRPGVPGVSDHIRVISIVDRFLEHARIYYFRNGGEPEMLLGSADLRPRNLDRRVEILFPVKDHGIRDAILSSILTTHLSDTVKARELHSDGEYTRVRPGEGGVPLRSQGWLIEHRGIWHRR